MKITPMCGKHECTVVFVAEGFVDELISGDPPYELDLERAGWQCEGLQQEILDIADNAELNDVELEEPEYNECQPEWYFKLELQTLRLHSTFFEVGR